MSTNARVFLPPRFIVRAIIGILLLLVIVSIEFGFVASIKTEHNPRSTPRLIHTHGLATKTPVSEDAAIEKKAEEEMLKYLEVSAMTAVSEETMAQAMELYINSNGALTPEEALEACLE